MALANIAAMVPAAPGYVGTFDAAVLLGVRWPARAPRSALPYVVLVRFVLFAPITIVGLVGWSPATAAGARSGPRCAGRGATWRPPDTRRTLTPDPRRRRPPRRPSGASSPAGRGAAGSPGSPP